MKRRSVAGQSRRIALTGLASTVLLSACGGGATSPTAGGPTEGASDGGIPSAAVTQAETPTVELVGTPSQVALAVAAGEGLFEGVNVEIRLVGYGEDTPMFIAGDVPLGALAPAGVARFVSEGEDICFFSTASSLNMWNGVIILAENAEKYRTIEDLVGQPLGNPGFGTDTWLSFEVVADELYGIDATGDFQPVTADPGALMGLVETGEIEGALNFAGQAATAIAHDNFELIFSFTEAWQEAHGQPMVVSGLVARRAWFDENREIAQRIIDGADRGVEWMKDHPEEFVEGGKYADWVAGEGWLRDQQTNDAIIDLLQEGEWYFMSDLYTDAWIDSTYEFVSSGVGTLVPDLPDKEEIFCRP